MSIQNGHGHGVYNSYIKVKTAGGVVAYGHRRPYIFVGVLLAAMCYVGLGLVEAISFNFEAFAALFFFIAVAHELWDNALDAYGNVRLRRSVFC